MFKTNVGDIWGKWGVTYRENVFSTCFSFFRADHLEKLADVSVKFTYSGVDAALDRVEAAIARAAQRGDEGRSAFDDGRGGATTLSCLTNRNYDAIVGFSQVG